MTDRLNQMNATLRLMRYASAALATKYQDSVTYADLRTSADDCRIALRAATGQPLELAREGRRHE